MKPQSTSRNGDNRIVKASNRGNNIFEKLAIFMSYALVAIFFPIAIFLCIIVVKEYERVVVLRMGRNRKNGLLGPGASFIVPCIDNAMRVDLRTYSFDVPPQDILTKDSVSIKVDAILYTRVKDPIKAVLEVVDAQESSKFLAQTTIRTIIGTKFLFELISLRTEISKEILEIMDETTDAWGIKVEHLEIKEITLPETLQKAFAQEAEALREAKAKIASAEGELLASKALKDASDVLGESPFTLQLRYMQTLSVITNGQPTTIIFPVPVDILPPDTLK